MPVLKPVKIRTGEFADQLRALDPDLLIVAAYGRILPDSVLEAARLMPLNIHVSLLPHHRGAAPVEGAILSGDSETGVTIMRITQQMDAGPILLQRAIPIAPDDTQGTLKVKLAELGAVLMLEALDKLRRGDLTRDAAGRKPGHLYDPREEGRRDDRLERRSGTNRADDARLRSVAGRADHPG